MRVETVQCQVGTGSSVFVRIPIGGLWSQKQLR